jgi:hypothetical protein
MAGVRGAHDMGPKVGHRSDKNAKTWPSGERRAYRGVAFQDSTILSLRSPSAIHAPSLPAAQSLSPSSSDPTPAGQDNTSLASSCGFAAVGGSRRLRVLNADRML